MNNFRIGKTGAELLQELVKAGEAGGVRREWIEQMGLEVMRELGRIYDRMVQEEDFEKKERFVREAVLSFGGRLLEALFEVRKERGYKGRKIECECTGEAEFEGYREKRITTMLGDIRLKRAYYSCSRCGRGVAPLDEKIGVGRGRMSPGVKRIASWLGGQTVFEEASEILEKVGNVVISQKSVERISEDIGMEIGKMRQKQIREVMEDPYARYGEGEDVKRVYVQADGGMVHLLDGWHEAKIGRIFRVEGEDGDDSKGVKLGNEFVGTLEKADKYWERMFEGACRIGVLKAKEVIAIGDGAPWIWNGVEEHFPKAVQIVDWYHAMQHIWGLGNANWGEGDKKTKEWVKKQETLLWEGWVEKVVRNMKRLRPRNRELEEKIRQEVEYFRRNAERMRYGKFRAKGYFIGSGEVESACKQVLNMRMKRSSMRWSRKGAQAILQLRSSILGGRFYEDWLAYRQAG